MLQSVLRLKREMLIDIEKKLKAILLEEFLKGTNTYI